MRRHLLRASCTCPLQRLLEILRSRNHAASRRRYQATGSGSISLRQMSAVTRQENNMLATKMTVRSIAKVTFWFLTLSVPHFSDCSKMSLPNRSGLYWSNPPFLISNIRAREREPECQKLKNGGLDQYGPGRSEV